MGFITDINESEGDEGMLELLLSLLLGLNTPQARSLHNSFALQSNLLLLLRDLLLKAGTPPPDNLLHLITRMQKKHQRRLQRRQRAAARNQFGDSKIPFPPYIAPTMSPGPNESQQPPPIPHLFTSLLESTETSATDPGLDSRGTSQGERDESARSRPA